MIALTSFIKILKDSGVTDKLVIETMCNVDRTKFLEPVLQQYAWQNQTLPIGNGQTISLPSMVGLMTQELELKSSDKVLEIGTGCGYQSIILANLCSQVYSVERHPSLLKLAKKRFKDMQVYNIMAIVDDGSCGFLNQEPFDKIILTCCAIDIPMHLVDKLKVGGIMVVPVGESDEKQDLLKIIKLQDKINIIEIGKVDFVPMLEGIGS